MITDAANLAGRISNPELRELAAYALDEIHAWRCGTFTDMAECEAVTDVFIENGDTKVAKVLQPLTLWRSWYITGPFHNWLSVLQHWDEDLDVDRPSWRWDWGILQPWKHFAQPRDEFKLIARFAAARTWYSADSFIADYVAAAAPRLVGGLGTPTFFYGSSSSDTHYHPGPDEDDGLARACYEYSLTVLGEMARDAVDPDFSDMEGVINDFADALAEAIKIGMLWD